MNQLIEYAEQVILDYPELREEITELVQLCQLEIDEGSDVSESITICLYGIKQFIES